MADIADDPLETIKRKYDALVKLRQTDAEESAAKADDALKRLKQTGQNLVDKLRAKLEQQTDASAQLVDGVNIAAQLTAENETLRERIRRLEAEPSVATAHAPAAAADDDDAAAAPLDASRLRVRRLERSLDMYRRLTGLELVLGDSADVAECSLRGAASNSASFNVNFAAEGVDVGDLVYQPGASNVELPDYLREEIVFAEAQAPGLVGKIMAAVLK